MKLLLGVRERIGAVIGVGVVSVLFLCMGIGLAFFISPKQAVEWRRVEHLPQLDAGAYEALAAGEEMVITGSLQGNAPLTEDGLVAYIRDQWNVTPPDPSQDEDQPDGDWSRIETAAPALVIAVPGGTVMTASSNSALFQGSIPETTVEGDSDLSATYSGQSLPDGTIRTRGFHDGDLITVHGQKGSTGDIIPERLFYGDRVELVDYMRSGARASFAIGIGMMICAPIVFVGGVLAAVFGRRRSL
jgi:hypothetical protein